MTRPGPIFGKGVAITGVVSIGTFTANGASAVTVADKTITATSFVLISINTVDGTPAGQPFLTTITSGTGFTVEAVAGDTSVYNYMIINS